MADQYTPEEIQRIFEAYHDAVRKGIPISEDLAKEMNDAVKGVKNYTNTLNFSLKQLGTSSLELSKNLYKGAEGAAVFNDAIDSAANTVSVMLGPFGLFGKILGTIIKVAGKYVGAVNKQADTLYKTYQDISRAGTIGAGGMTEVYQQMQKFGYSLDELGQMTSLLKENSQVLARFGGTAFQGAKELGDLAQVMQRGELGATFRNMGASVDEINRYLAGYIKRETGLGQTRSQINKNLEVETERYLKELIAVQKLTGQTREQLEEKEAQAQAEQAFAYTQYELKKRAAEGDQQAAEELRRNTELNRVLEGKAREEFVKAIGGDVSAMEKLMLTTPEFVSMLNSGVTDTGKLMDTYAREVKQSVDNLGEAAKFNFYNDFQLPMSENLKVISQYTEKTYAELLKAAQNNSATTDAATQEQTKLRMAQMNTRENLNDLINMGISPLTKAMAYLAEVVDELTSLLPGGKSKGYGQKGTGTMGGSLAATGAGALAGSVFGPVGTVLGGVAGYVGYQMHGGTARAGAPVSNLRIKPGAGDATDRLSQVAMQIQEKLGGDLKYFSSFNDDYHKGTNSKHAQGLAMDFTIVDPSQAARIADIVRGISGIRYVQDEYTNPSSRSTAGHIHAEISGASGWQGQLSGPMSGYRPNILMHGNEELTIRPGTTSGSNSTTVLDTGMGKLNEKLDEMIYLAKAQLGVNEKIMRAQA
jgi:hypothetical protein